LKKAIVLGLTGQDGSYLAELLSTKGYEVHGIIRRVSTPNMVNINHFGLDMNMYYHDGDITDLSSLVRLFRSVQPDEIYNLAAQSFVGSSWTQPILTSNVTGMGALNVFEAARQACPEARIYQASTSEMFGGDVYPQDEETTFSPRSPYGVAKLFAHNMARVYRESFNMHISCGILFNHESPRRGIEFVTQKIVRAAVNYYLDGYGVLEIGNPYAKRDWSHAKDMVYGMWLMLQQETPDDYVMSSNESHSVMEFISKTYGILDIPLAWVENPDDLPYAIGARNNKFIVRCVPEFYRPNEVNVLLGNADKARRILGWTPKYSFDDLVHDMVESALNR
jgi:GDPmannose 4,6-dehydratase